MYIFPNHMYIIVYGSATLWLLVVTPEVIWFNLILDTTYLMPRMESILNVIFWNKVENFPIQISS
jgi:hypothetical protein